MLTFHKKYHPITSRPFLSSPLYTEYRPCEALRPFISCYWTTKEAADREEAGDVLVIPDTCMDVIVYMNHGDQTVSGYLCSLDDEPFISSSGKNAGSVNVFAIRFYFWAAHLFLKMDFKAIASRRIALTDLDREWKALFEPFFYLPSTEQQISRVEQFLLKKLEYAFPDSNLFNSFDQILTGNGSRTVKEICEYSCVSQRQMERQFLQSAGLPMKRISSLVRYQNVWRDLVYLKEFDIQDEVYRYGYADQPHLLKEFRRFHGVTMEEARTIAYRNR